jgi:2-dehydropantoate 2-reductase
MKKNDLSILVIGAGAIGGITAAMLKKAGYNITLVAKYPDYAEKIRSTGIRISGKCGRFTAIMPAVSSVSEVTEAKDIIFLAVKANDMADAARQALPLLSGKGYMVSMQNGICEYELSTIAGEGKTIGCVVGWGATMVSPGEMQMTSEGDFIIGYPGREPDEDLKRMASMLESVVPVRTTSNIFGHRYAKLIINSCITSPGAICGLYLGQMLSVKRMRRIFVNIIREAVAVANAMNLRLEVFGGRLDFYKFIEKSGWMADLKRDITIRIIGFKYRRLKSSSLQSLERGKPSEIDYLNGFIVEKAAQYNVAVPVNARIVEIVKRIEKGQLQIGIANFDDTVFD